MGQFSGGSSAVMPVGEVQVSELHHVSMIPPQDLE